MIIATKIQHDQAKLLRWKLNPWLSTAFKTALTRIINSHTDDAELASEDDAEKLAKFCTAFDALLNVEGEAEDETQEMGVDAEREAATQREKDNE